MSCLPLELQSQHGLQTRGQSWEVTTRQFPVSNALADMYDWRESFMSCGGLQILSKPSLLHSHLLESAAITCEVTSVQVDGRARNIWALLRNYNESINLNPLPTRNRNGASVPPRKGSMPEPADRIYLPHSFVMA
jgi:hypothetical protein